MSDSRNDAARSPRGSLDRRGSRSAYVFVAVVLVVAGIALAPTGPGPERAVSAGPVALWSAASGGDGSLPDASSVLAGQHRAIEEPAPTF